MIRPIGRPSTAYSECMRPTRRGFLALPAMWAQALDAAQSHRHDSTPQSATYVFRFLKPAERQVLNSLAALLIPADERSGGALAARIDEYIDFILAHAPAPLQRRWREGLASYSGLNVERRDRKLAAATANEFTPRTRDEEFFVLLKGAVAEGFYTSQEGITRELGYQGLGSVRDFEGCTHEIHRAPEGFQPLLKARK